MNSKRQYNAEMEAVLSHLETTGTLDLSSIGKATNTKNKDNKQNRPMRSPGRPSGQQDMSMEGPQENDRLSSQPIEQNSIETKNNKINLDLTPAEPSASRADKPTLLLHSCCGPCSTSVLERLLPYFSITVFYYNPNILPKEEYDKRLGEQRRLLASMGGISLVEGKYDPQRFLFSVRGLEDEPEGGKRCERCFALRMEETARLCRDGGYDLFTTTLTVSPHKNAQMVNQACERAAASYHVAALPADFKKRGGYQRSLELSRHYALYRQSFCGCPFSNPAQQAFHSPLSEGV